MGKSNKLWACVAVSAMLQACGSSGGSDGPEVSSRDLANNGSQGASSSSATAVKTGVFLDSPVENIGYRTATMQGVTSNSGEFQYIPGEMITFFIGDLELPAVLAKSVVTPLDIAGSADPNNAIAVNIARLLQSLDDDGDAETGIRIPNDAMKRAQTVDFDQPVIEFAADAAVKQVLPIDGQLVSVPSALGHLASQLAERGLIDDTDADNDGILDVVDSNPASAEQGYDSDFDGAPDSVDAFPDDPSESEDADGDGIGDNVDVPQQYQASIEFPPVGANVGGFEKTFTILGSLIDLEGMPISDTEEISVTVNDQPAEFSAVDSHQWSVDVPIIPGENELTVQVKMGANLDHELSQVLMNSALPQPQYEWIFPSQGGMAFAPAIGRQGVVSVSDTGEISELFAVKDLLKGSDACYYVNNLIGVSGGILFTCSKTHHRTIDPVFGFFDLERPDVGEIFHAEEVQPPLYDIEIASDFLGIYSNPLLLSDEHSLIPYSAVLNTTDPASVTADLTFIGYNHITSDQVKLTVDITAVHSGLSTGGWFDLEELQNTLWPEATISFVADSQKIYFGTAYSISNPSAALTSDNDFFYEINMADLSAAINNKSSISLVASPSDVDPNYIAALTDEIRVDGWSIEYYGDGATNILVNKHGVEEFDLDLGFFAGEFSVDREGSLLIGDPSLMRTYIYKPGEASPELLPYTYGELIHGGDLAQSPSTSSIFNYATSTQTLSVRDGASLNKQQSFELSGTLPNFFDGWTQMAVNEGGDTLYFSSWLNWWAAVPELDSVFVYQHNYITGDSQVLLTFGELQNLLGLPNGCCLATVNDVRFDQTNQRLLAAYRLNFNWFAADIDFTFDKQAGLLEYDLESKTWSIFAELEADLLDSSPVISNVSNSGSFVANKDWATSINICDATDCIRHAVLPSESDFGVLSSQIADAGDVYFVTHQVSVGHGAQAGNELMRFNAATGSIERVSHVNENAGPHISWGGELVNEERGIFGLLDGFLVLMSTSTGDSIYLPTPATN